MPGEVDGASLLLLLPGLLTMCWQQQQGVLLHYCVWGADPGVHGRAARGGWRSYLQLPEPRCCQSCSLCIQR